MKSYYVDSTAGIARFVLRDDGLPDEQCRTP
jgi:hypothetical protein